MCLWTAKKSVDACLFAPNESPILRILGMNNRNKITFKLLHLTVEAWRLQWLQSFPQLTSHTCNRPAGFTQEAYGAATGRDTSPLSNTDFYSAAGPIHACTPAAWRPGCIAQTALIWVNSNFVFMGGHRGYKEYSVRIRLSQSEVGSS